MAKATQLPDAPADAALTAGAEALFALLHIQANVVRSIDDDFDRAHGTGLSGFELLARLAAMHPDGASVRYLAEQVVVSPSRVSRLTEELVARGWVERAASPQDGRLSLVRLTGSGRATLDEMKGTFARALQTHLLDALTAKQLTALVGIGRALGAPHC